MEDSNKTRPLLAAGASSVLVGDDKEPAKRPDSMRGRSQEDGKGGRALTAASSASAAAGSDVVDKLVKLGLSGELAERAWRETGKK